MSRFRIVLLLCLTFVLASPSALAADGLDRDDDRDRIGPNTAERPSATLGSVAPSVLDANGVSAYGDSPAGCQGKSNNPHKSSGQVKGVTQVDCNYNVSSLYTDAQVWRKRWWGYEKIGTKGKNNNAWDDQVKASGWSVISCVDNWYRTSGYHTSVESSGFYHSSTLKNAYVDC